MKFIMLTSVFVLAALSASIDAKGQGCGGPWTTSETRTSASTTTAPPELERSIYFATSGQGISAISMETNHVRKIVNSPENLYGIAYNSISNKLYWCNAGTIYRANVDGTGAQTLLRTTQYGTMHDLAVDWISGNVYVATVNGGILACGHEAELTFNCFAILSDQSFASGITLDPTEGLMYWTRGSVGSIHRSGMDGSSPITLLTALRGPLGVKLDLASRRLYWAEYSSHQIKSSDLDGRDIQLVAQLPSRTYPWGIAISNDRIYWGNPGNRTLQSCLKDGQDVQALYTEAGYARGLAIVPAVDQPTNRVNDCAGRQCSTLCVLTQASYRCLA